MAADRDRGQGLGRRTALLGLAAGLAPVTGCGARAQQAPRRPAEPPAAPAALRPVTSPEGAIALQFQNAGTRPLPAGIATFGLGFLPGELPRAAGLAARIGQGAAQPVQIDVKTRWPDGSARFAVAAMPRPELAARQVAEAVLARAAPDPTPPITLPEALEGHLCRVVIAAGEGGSGVAIVDVVEELRAALALRRASHWMQGPLATQARVETLIPGTSLRVVADVTAFRGGRLAVDLQFANDRAMEPAGGRIGYTATVVLDGTMVARQRVDHGQYQMWRRRVATGADGGQGLGGPGEGWLNIRHDIQRLIRAAVFARYDLTLRIPEALLQRYAQAMAQPGWGQPLSANGVQPFMPMAGGRADIGITTIPATAWLLSQDARAAAYTMGWAEAAGAVPWRYREVGRGAWLNAGDYPHLWVQSRGGANPRGTPGDRNSLGPTQYYDRDDWTPEAAHQPDLSFVPYILTGERWILDNLEAQAAWNTVYNWPGGGDPRGERRNTVTGAMDLVVRNTEIRAGAWALRQLENAFWAAPDDSPQKAYYRRAADANWRWILSQIPEWTRAQGELHGYMPGVLTGNGVVPWQQDYFASIAILAAARGSREARAVLDWSRNFLIGRFEQPVSVFNPRDGIANGLLVRVGTTTMQDPWQGLVTTWAQFGQLNVETGRSNGDGWARSGGNYGMWAMSTLAGIWHLTGDARARAAYEKLAALNPPYTSASDFANEPSSPVTIPGLYGGTRR